MSWLCLFLQMWEDFSYIRYSELIIGSSVSVSCKDKSILNFDNFQLLFKVVIHFIPSSSIGDFLLASFLPGFEMYVNLMGEK